MNITKVAEMAGVSNTTVSFVINGKPGISPDTVDRVKKAIRQSGYVPRSTGHKRVIEQDDALKMRNIGIIMSAGVMSTIPFYARLFEAIHKELDKRDITMTPIRCGDAADLSKSTFDDLDGVILCNYIKNIIELLSIPFVTILGHPSVEDKLNADHIEPANDRIGVAAAKYLLERGHKRLLAINPSFGCHPAMDTRNQYFEEIAVKNGADVELRGLPFKERDKYGRLIDGLTIDNVREFVEEFAAAKERATAIFVPCDSHMVIIQKSLFAMGVDVGSDVEIIGCNNESILLDGIQPRPATIDINPQAMARAAIVALLQRILHPDEYDNVYKVVGIEPTLLPAGQGVRQQW